MEIHQLGSEAIEAVNTDCKIELASPRQEEKCSLRRRRLAIIVAAGDDGAIGIGGAMIWHLPADLRHFKKVTSGGTVIMGRKTWQSLPKAPLPQRRNIVVTRDTAFRADGAEVYHSLREAVDAAAADRDVFIIGGGEIYRQAMDMVDTVYLTRIFSSCREADTFFRLPDPACWKTADCSDTMTSDEGIRFRFETWVRK